MDFLGTGNSVTIQLSLLKWHHFAMNFDHTAQTVNIFQNAINIGSMTAQTGMNAISKIKLCGGEVSRAHANCVMS